MNIYKIYAIIGPWTTPAPAAIALAARLYGELEASGYVAAWSVAIFSLVALEVVGALSTKEMIYSTSKRDWTWFWVALIGVAIYAGLGVYALWGLSAWIYVILAIFVHIAVTRSQQHQEERRYFVEDREKGLKEKELELQREKERTKQLNAEARRAKAEQPVLLDTTPIRSIPSEQPSKAERAKEYLAEHPSASERELAQAVGCSASTAHGYMKRFREK